MADDSAVTVSIRADVSQMLAAVDAARAKLAQISADAKAMGAAMAGAGATANSAMVRALAGISSEAGKATGAVGDLTTKAAGLTAGLAAAGGEGVETTLALAGLTAETLTAAAASSEAATLFASAMTLESAGASAAAVDVAVAAAVVAAAEESKAAAALETAAIVGDAMAVEATAADASAAQIATAATVAIVAEQAKADAITAITAQVAAAAEAEAAAIGAGAGASQIAAAALASGAAFDTLGGSVGTARARFAELQAEAARLGAQMVATGAFTDKSLVASLARVQGESRQVRAALGAMEAGLAGAGTATAGAGAAAVSLGEKMAAAAPSLGYVTREARALADEMSSGRWRQFDGTLVNLIGHSLGMISTFAAANPVLTAMGVAAAGAAGWLGFLEVKAIESANAAERLRASANLAGGLVLPSDQYLKYIDVLQKARNSNLELAESAIRAFQSVQGATSASLSAMVADFESLTAAGTKPADAIKKIAEAFGDSMDQSLKSVKNLIPGITADQELQIRQAQRLGDISAVQSKIQLAFAENNAREAKAEIADNSARIASAERLLAATRAASAGAPGDPFASAGSLGAAGLEAQIAAWKEENRQIQAAADNVTTLSNKIREIPQTPSTTIKSGQEAGQGYGQTGAIEKTEADIARITGAMKALDDAAKAAKLSASEAAYKKVDEQQSYIDELQKRLDTTRQAAADVSTVKEPNRGQEAVQGDAQRQALELKIALDAAQKKLEELKDAASRAIPVGAAHTQQYKDLAQQLADANTRLKELQATQRGGTDLQKLEADQARRAATIGQDALKTAQERLAVAQRTLAADQSDPKGVNAEKIAKDNADVTAALAGVTRAQNDLTSATSRYNEVVAKGSGDARKTYEAQQAGIDARRKQTTDPATLTNLDAEAAQTKIEYQQKVREETITADQVILDKEESDTKQKLDGLNELAKTHQITTAAWLQQTLAALDAEAAKFTEVKTREENLDSTTSEQRARTAQELAKKLEEIATEETQAQNKAAEQTAQQWQTITQQINSAFDSQINGLLTGTENFGQAMKKVLLQLTEDLTKFALNKALTQIEKPFEGIFNSLSGGVASAGIGAVAPAATAALPGAAGSAATIAALGANTAALTLGTGSTTVNTAVTTTQTGGQVALTAATSPNTLATIANTAATQGGGIFGAIGHLFGFAEGTNYVPYTGLALVHKGEAIIPASQNDHGRIQLADTGIYDAPRDALTLVHASELIMPAPQAEAFREMLEARQASAPTSDGAPGGSRNVTVNPQLHAHISAMDSSDVFRTLSNNQSALTKALHQAVRHGAALGLR